MSTLRIDTALVFEPLLHPARFKGAYGGRGSGKSHFFAEHLVEDCLSWPGMAGEGMRALCFREVQKSLKQSSKFLIESKLKKFGLGEKEGFKVFDKVIQTPGDGIIEFIGMQAHTADSFKSYEGFHRAVGEETQTISERSISMLIPTIRWEDTQRGLESELWFAWNPSRASDPVDKMFRGPNPPPNSRVVRANWSDNPWFPAVLNKDRVHAQQTNPDQYGHIWEGEYARVFKGAYYASHLEAAEREGRIAEYTKDPILRCHAYWDIGGTSNTSDATAIWVVQFIGEEIRVLDYYEAVGQEFGEHVGWLQRNGYSGALMHLPHDGKTHDKVHKVTPRSFLNDAGFEVKVANNLGAGAAMRRIEAARRIFPRCKFNRITTQPGRDALAWYHEKWDDDRNIGLGPMHDDSSHGADAFGEMAVDVLQSPPTLKWSTPKRRLKGV